MIVGKDDICRGDEKVIKVIKFSFSFMIKKDKYFFRKCQHL